MPRPGGNQVGHIDSKKKKKKDMKEKVAGDFRLVILGQGNLDLGQSKSRSGNRKGTDGKDKKDGVKCGSVGRS